MIPSSLQLIPVEVSALAPPEPMRVILTALAKLTPQECLLVKHRRQPFPLYEKLKEANFAYYCVEHTQHSISLYIYHQSSQALFDVMLANKLINKGRY